MTRRFKPADFSFQAPAVSKVDGDAVTALERWQR